MKRRVLCVFFSPVLASHREHVRFRARRKADDADG